MTSTSADSPMESPATMSVTRALVELKTLGKRTEKLTDELDLVRVVRKGDNRDQQTFVKNAKSKYQALGNLVHRRDTLKSRIIESNAKTRVVLGHLGEYSVAEVIDLKQNIGLKQNILQTMRKQRQSSQATFEAREAEVRLKLDRLLEIEFGKDTKSNVGNVATITDSYMASNRVELLDPIGLDAQIDILSTEIEFLEKEADLVLSESNALTQIQLV